jgi:DNA-binding SARP family transcriptional activator
VAAALEAALETLEHAPPPPLVIQLLGAFSLRRGERVIEPGDWPRPAVRRLFQYLALHPGEQLSRDQILEDLWAGADPAAARSSFNQHISWLRRLLEPHMRPRAASRYLTVEEDRYCFAPPPVAAVVQVDVAGFEAAVRPVLAAARRQEVPPLPPALLEALAGWQPLLPDAPYEGWTQAPRERLLSLYLDGCLYVAQSLLDLGRPADAAVWAARVVAAGPWLEDGFQALMRAQARQGSRSHALKTYAEAVAALQRELGAAPSALTQWLARRLQQGEEI